MGTSISVVGLTIFIATVIVSYFIGNISPAILIGRACGIDIKKEGSGNAGTTNVLRVLGKKAALATLVIDIFKGVASVWLGYIVSNYISTSVDMAYTLPACCAVAVFCGHIWPAAFEFKGGKGVATAFGALVTLSVPLGLLALAIVLIVVLITKRVSAGSICGAASVPILAYIFVPESIVQASIMALIVIYKHKDNIKRLAKGQEPKLSFKK